MRPHIYRLASVMLEREDTASRGSRFQVVATTLVTPAIRHIVLEPAENGPPAWSAGAHVRVALPAGGDRPYSLLSLPGADPRQLSLGVLLEENSAGGSRFMHALKTGDDVVVSQPENNFSLHDSDEPAVLFAGGIGITPILSMAAELKARGTSYVAHYAGRMPGALAFLEPMREICQEALTVHYDSDDSRLDIVSALSAAHANAHIYLCGPSGMIEAVKSAALDKGIAADRIHFELFKPAATAWEVTGFEVEVASTGQSIFVAANQTIIQALEAAGLTPLYDCLRGDCGICQTGVISGIPDHCDVILTDSERASNKIMQICVSRAKTPRLVLDL
jgi:vanillate O-demethylase ferredoxin subunit